MIFEKHGLLAEILDPESKALSEYQVEKTADDTIQCWVPSTEGNNFKIRWKIVKLLHPGHDLRTDPFLDGVQHYEQPIGTTTARLYEFGKRTLTDSNDYAKPDEFIIKNLNTIKLKFTWGNTGKLVPYVCSAPQEIELIHEKAAKKGHSGAAKLGKTITIPTPASVDFAPDKAIKPITFVIPTDWLRARDIIPGGPETISQDNQGILKRERSTTPEIIDIDDLETDDDEIQIIKHMIPAPAPNNKRQRVERRDEARPKKEEE
ncbi:unnamed protein product [Rhizoctonia solani]|uniref:Uncharacterized protein n=1 Tax=Rhizoctonia solani TaxID=456999 RepID=A0A8H2X7W0_9AGAM|nr:unnamed protein product [Rhizoctonia solani]